MASKSFFNNLNEVVKEHQNDNEYPNVELANLAVKIIKNQPIRNKNDAFLVFSALNYLNYATKKERCIGYSFKSAIKDVVNKIRRANSCADLYYSSQGDILYAAFDNFLFSFHNPSLDNEQKAALSLGRWITFDGIKKQPCATLIFNEAIRLINSATYVNQNNNVEQTRSVIRENNCTNKCTFTPLNFSIQSIIDHYHLRYITTSEEVATNCALVINLMYFYRDLIKSASPKLDEKIERSLFREMITQTYSVIEAVEIEIGSMLLGVTRPNKHDLILDQKCISATRKITNIPGGSNESILKGEYKRLRNNVHLSKKQSILNDENYTRNSVVMWFSFMEQYLNYLYAQFKNYRKS